jgi:hypothetical protein
MSKNKSIKYQSYNFLPYLILFASSVIFFTFFADYVEFYQEKTSLFVFSGDYLKDIITQPGSFVIYIGSFLTTFYYYPFCGAIIISFTICLITYFISRIMSFLSGEKAIMIPILFGIAFFILHTSFKYLFYNSLGVLVQLIFFFLSLKYPKHYIPVIFFPLLYLLTGGFAWIFGLMYILHLSLSSIKKNWIRIILIPAIAFICIFLLKGYFLFQPGRELLLFPFSFDDLGPLFKLFFPLIGVIVLLPLIIKIKIRFPKRIKQKETHKLIIISVLVFMIMTAASCMLFDKVYYEYFHVEKLFYNKKYTEITQYLREHPSTNRLTIFLNNIALCETGRLNDQLFNFPQSPDGQSLFLKWEMVGEVLRRGGYFYYTTGMINEAHRWAYENIVMKGLTPEDLKMLIKTDIIDGNYKVARKYISILRKTIFYRKEAFEFEKQINDNSTSDQNSELDIKREEMIKHDFFSITDNPYINLEKVLLYDSLNHKALEYKLAYLMLIEDYKGITDGLARLESLGYTKIPLHLEEAFFVCKMSDPKLPEKLGKLTINPSTENRFLQFLQTFQSYGNNLKTAQPFLNQKFGNTFWYWGFYH